MTRILLKIWGKNYKFIYRGDFYLLCYNALIYNMPNSKVYKEAKKMDIIIKKAFEFFDENLNMDDTYLIKYDQK